MEGVGGGVMGENEVSKSMEEDGSWVSYSPKREKTQKSYDTHLELEMSAWIHDIQ